MKVAERELARRLRREQGLPIKSIAAAIGVSSSSVSRWVRDVELTSEQAAALRDANPIYNRQRSGTARSSANARSRRVAAQQDGARLAHAGDPLHQIGCMLYWAEGARNRNQLVFTNSDPEMVDLFVHFLRRCYGVTDERIALTVNVHLGNELTLEQIEAWWLRRLGLPPGSLRRSVVNRPSRLSRRKRLIASVRHRTHRRVLDRSRAKHPRRNPDVRCAAAARLARVIKSGRGSARRPPRRRCR